MKIRKVKRGRVKNRNLPRTKIVVEAGFKKILSQLDRVIESLGADK